MSNQAPTEHITAFLQGRKRMAQWSGLPEHLGGVIARVHPTAEEDGPDVELHESAILAVLADLADAKQRLESVRLVADVLHATALTTNSGNTAAVAELLAMAIQRHAGPGQLAAGDIAHIQSLASAAPTAGHAGTTVTDPEA
jgi:hypothetical protein